VIIVIPDAHFRDGEHIRLLVHEEGASRQIGGYTKSASSWARLARRASALTMTSPFRA